MAVVGAKEQQLGAVRLFVGGLPPGVAAGQLQQRFQPFGQATVHVLPPKEGSADGESKRSFCYVDLQPKDASSLHRCLSAYNHSKWLGHVLRVEVAKPDYLTRLQAEWEEDARTGGFRPQRRAGKRKRGPEEDGEEEWNGIPVPLDTSKPITFTVGPRRRNKKPKVLKVPLDPASARASVKQTFPQPARVLPPSALQWEHPSPPQSALYILQELWEQGGPPASPPTAHADDDDHHGGAQDTPGQRQSPWHLATAKGAAMPPPASLQVQQQQQAAKVTKQQQQQQVAAPTKGQLPGAEGKGMQGAQPVAQPTPAPAPAAAPAPAPISAEKHAYLKVIKSLKTANQKEEASAAAAAAAAAAKAATRANKNAGKAGRPGAASTAAGVQALQGRGTAGTAGIAPAPAGTSQPSGPAVVSFEDEDFGKGGADGIGKGGGAMDLDLDRFGSDSEENDKEQVRSTVKGKQAGGAKQSALLVANLQATGKPPSGAEVRTAAVAAPRSRRAQQPPVQHQDGGDGPEDDDDDQEMEGHTGEDPAVSDEGLSFGDGDEGNAVDSDCDGEGHEAVEEEEEGDQRGGDDEEEDGSGLGTGKSWEQGEGQGEEGEPLSTGEGDSDAGTGADEYARQQHPTSQAHQQHHPEHQQQQGKQQAQQQQQQQQGKQQAQPVTAGGVQSAQKRAAAVQATIQGTTEPQSSARPASTGSRLLGGMPVVPRGAVVPGGLQYSPVMPQGKSGKGAGRVDLSRFGSDSEESFHDVDDEEQGGQAARPVAAKQATRKQGATPKAASAQPSVAADAGGNRAGQAGQKQGAVGKAASAQPVVVPGAAAAAAAAVDARGRGAGADTGAAKPAAFRATVTNKGAGQLKAAGAGVVPKGGGLSGASNATQQATTQPEPQHQQAQPQPADHSNKRKQANATPAKAGLGHTAAGADIASRFGSDSEESFHDVDEEEENGSPTHQVVKQASVRQPNKTQGSAVAAGPKSTPLLSAPGKGIASGAPSGAGTGPGKAPPAAAAGGKRTTEPGATSTTATAGGQQQASKGGPQARATEAPPAATATLVSGPVSAQKQEGITTGNRTAQKSAVPSSTGGVTGTAEKQKGTGGFSFSFFGAPASSPPDAAAQPESAEAGVPAAAAATHSIGSAHKGQAGSRQQQHSNSHQHHTPRQGHTSGAAAMRREQQASGAMQAEQVAQAHSKPALPLQKPAVTPAPAAAVKPAASPVAASALPAGAKPRTGPLQFATTFMRTKSSEEVRAAWLAQREALATSFKQMQRTATKQSSKQQGIRKPTARR